MRKRLSTFGLVLPFKVELVHALKSSDISRSEWCFHDFFKHKRLKGEWFDLDEKDVAYFCEAGTEHGVGKLFHIEPTVNFTAYKLKEKK